MARDSGDSVQSILGLEESRGGSSEPSGLWGRAFRPFFLALSVYAAVAVPWWSLAWLGLLPTPAWLAPMWWHGHEMVFGIVAAAIAGFLLTAAPVWTGRAALTGSSLMALVVLWGAGRFAFAGAGWLPATLVAAVDVAFLPVVGLVLWRTLWGSGQIWNYGVLAIVLALTAANASMHAAALGVAPGGAGRALRFGVDLVVVLLLVISGRITPAFTRNALRARGVDVELRSPFWLNALAVGAAAVLALLTLVGGRTMTTGSVAVVAGVLVAARLAGWQSWHTRSDPLLWSLHLGSAWVSFGLLLTGASNLGLAVPPTAGLHALTAGAMGATILAVVTRVGMGHTGRALELPRGAVWCHVLVNVGALLRVAAPFCGGDSFRALLVLSGVAWGAAFATFAVCYWPILTTPRPDGRAG